MQHNGDVSLESLRCNYSLCANTCSSLIQIRSLRVWCVVGDSLGSSSEVFLPRLELQNRPLSVKSYLRAAVPFIVSVFEEVFKFVECIFSETDPLSLWFNVDCNFELRHPRCVSNKSYYKVYAHISSNTTNRLGGMLFTIRNSQLRLSQWPRGLRRRSTAARPLRLWVRIPPRAWMFVLWVLCVVR